MGIKFYIYLLIALILGSIYQVLNISMIFYFSPTLIAVTGYLFQLVAGLIYNEIIICNFCGLNEYTKKIY